MLVSTILTVWDGRSRELLAVGCLKQYRIEFDRLMFESTILV
ncbi:MAG: hypothetical protein ACRC62_11460 [Microcoleus sp.]